MNRDTNKSKYHDSKYFKIPKRLVDKIIDNKCILFIGAGISKKCIGKDRKYFPNWYEFLKELIEWGNNKLNYDKKYYEDLIQLLEKNNFLVLAEELLESIGSDSFNEYLKISLDTSNTTVSNLHKTISNIPFRGIITTNYDNLIEKSYTNNKNIFTSENILNGTNILNKSFFIFKMHGDILSPSSIILNYKSYLKLIYDSKEYQKMIKNIFTEYTVLFIGYGSNDKNIENILDRLSIINTSSNHYILSKKGMFTKIERDRSLKDRQLEVIEYYDKFKYHNHIDTFFYDIIDKINEIKSINIIKPKTLNLKWISVYYDYSDSDDGFYIFKYIFKEGAVVDNINCFNNDEAFDTLFQDINSISDINKKEKIIKNINIYKKAHSEYVNKYVVEDLLKVEFILFYFGNVNFDTSEYIKSVNEFVNSTINHTCKFIFISLEKNKQIINKKYQNQRIYYINDNFNNLDLEHIKQYIINNSTKGKNKL